MRLQTPRSLSGPLPLALALLTLPACGRGGATDAPAVEREPARAAGSATGAAAAAASAPTAALAAATAAVSVAAPPATPGASDAPGASAVASAGAVVSAGAPAARGLSAPGNDAETVAEIEKVRKGCAYKAGFASGCQALQDWIEWASFPGRQELRPTLIAALFDPSPAVRRIASIGLGVIGRGRIKDPVQAGLLFEALEGERVADGCLGIAAHAASVELAAVGLEERARKALREHPAPACRAALMDGILDTNPDLYPLAVELARTDKDLDVRRAAMQALRAGANRNPERQRQNCSVWLELLADPAPTIGDQSVFLLSNAGSRSLTVPCTEAWTSMIDQLLARPALDVRPAELVYLLDKRAAPELKPRVASVCRKVLENTAAREHARAGAVQCLDVADPDAHTYLERFEADPAPKVQAEVKRVRAKPRKTP